MPDTEATRASPGAGAPSSVADRAEPGPPPGTPEPEAEVTGNRRSWWPLAVVAVPFVVAFGVLAVRALTVAWHPVHDFALIELRVADVGTAHTPLVGPYSRFGWSHPGPLLFELLAIPYRLSGGRPQGLLVGAVLLNAASVAGALLVARRRGGAVLLSTVAIGLAVLMRAMGTDELMSPWNPWITVLPTVLLFLLGWSLAERDWALLPVGVLVGSFLVQTHVAYGALTVAVLGTGLALAAVTGVRRRRQLDEADPPASALSRGVLVATALVAVVVWLPPLVDLVVGGHNLADIARHFATAQPERPPMGTALGVVAAETAPVGPWVTGSDALVPFVGTVEPAPVWRLALPLGALVLGAGVARWRRDRAGARFAVVTLAGLVAAGLSVTRVNDALFAYIVRFLWPVALVVWLAALRALIPAAVDVAQRLWRAREPAPAWLGAVAVPVASALASAAVLVGVGGGLLGGRPPDPDQSPTMGTIADAVVPAVGGSGGGRGLALDDGGNATGTVLVRPLDGEVVFPVPNVRGLAAGLVPELEQAGVPVRVVEDDWRFPRGGGGAALFGDQRIDTGGPVAGTLALVSGAQVDAYRPPEGSSEVARVEDRAAVERARSLEAKLRDGFTAAGHPEAAAQVGTDQIRWLPFNVPELGRFTDDIEALLAAREAPRVVVYWEPGRH